MAGSAAGGSRKSRWGPLLLTAPALLYLAFFFILPLVTLGKTSLSTNAGSVFEPEWKFTGEISNFGDAVDVYRSQFARSFLFAGIATAISILLAYPLAYVIAFRSGRYKNALLGLVILPFFITFLVRTLAWKTILSDRGVVVDIFRFFGILPSSDRLLSTSYGVIGGLVYNFVPFMLLPLFVSLEKIDPRLLEASRDLYSSGLSAFRRVVLPLSLPGVFAGSLLTFIPAAGDFINARYLGSANETMVGTVIQNQFLLTKDYPLAAALSFILMALILISVMVYTSILGTEDLQ